MLKPENSQMLAKKIQIAKYNNDYKMVKKIESITKDNEITQDIIDYQLDKK